MIAIAIALVMLASARPAHADNVSDLLQQLTDSSDKVRLSAVAALARLDNHDAKVLFALIELVSENNESSDKVRGTAAFGLGKLIDASTSPSVKKLAIANLQKTQSGGQQRVRAHASR